MKPLEASFIEFIDKQIDDENKALLKDKINSKSMAEQMNYFNYGLTPNQWNMVANKQVYMKFERLFIEKQMNEVNKRKREFEEELARLD